MEGRSRDDTGVTRMNGCAGIMKGFRCWQSVNTGRVTETNTSDLEGL